MGILNSDLVKAGVDLLTNILNGINALTSGFGALDKGVGSVISSVMKLMLLFGGLNVGKGLLNGLITSVGNIAAAKTGGTIRNIGDVIKTSMLGSNTSGTMTALAGKGKLGTLAAGFLNPFAGIGNIAKSGVSTIWGGLKNFGMNAASKSVLASGLATKLTGAGATMGTAAGITGIATALAGVAAAATAVVVAYKAWEKYTPEGQLKVATKLAEKE